VAALAAIRDYIGGFGAMMAEISVAADEQSRTSLEVSKRVEASSQQAAQNAADVAQVSATVGEVAHTADDLARVAETLTAMVGQFHV